MSSREKAETNEKHGRLCVIDYNALMECDMIFFKMEQSAENRR